MRIAGLVLLALVLGLAGTLLYFQLVSNPRVARELRERPDGETARKVMLLTLPSGREIPCNYWREGDRVFAGADGPWWRELADGPRPVTVFVQGESLAGQGRAVRDDPEYRARVFAKLRPNAIPFFGTLVEIVLEPPASPAG